METITQAISKLQEQQEKKLLQTSSTKDSLAGAIKPLLLAYSPTQQISVCEDKRKCFLGEDFPTLAAISKQFGDPRAAKAWLIPQITNLVEFSNSRNIINKEQIKECASLICSEYYYLKVSELMLFFHWFKAGKYGHFYSTVDPMKIMVALRDFIRERNEHLAKYEKEQHEAREKEDKKNAITYEEYVSRYGELSCFKKNAAVAVEKTESKQQKKSRAVSEDMLLKCSKDIVTNSYKADIQTLQRLCDAFKKNSGMTPKEYLNKRQMKWNHK